MCSKFFSSLFSALFGFILLFCFSTIAMAEPDASLNLTETQKKWLDQHQEIRLAIDISWPPFEWVDDNKQYKGMSSDYIHIIENKLGIKFIVNKEKNWPDAVEAVKNHELDVFSCVVDNKQRREYVDFTEPYLSFPMVIVTLNNVNHIKSIKDLKDVVVGVVDGYATHDYLNNEHPEINIKPKKTAIDGLNAVSEGKIGAFVGNVATMSYLIKEAGITNIKVSGKMPIKYDLGMAVRKDWPEFVDILQVALDSIKEEERHKIYDTWIGTHYMYKNPFNYKLALEVLAVFILVFIFFYIYNLKLMKEIKGRRIIEEELNIAKEAAEQATIAKGGFLARMSHEIRTPMNGVIGMISLLEETNLTETQKGYIQTIKDSGQSLLVILNEILEFSSLEANKVDIYKETFELYHSMDSIYHLFLPLIEEKGLEFNLSYGDNLPEFIIGDEGRIRQVIVNLLNNAKKFTDKGSIQLETTLLEQENGSKYIKFLIHDDGVGIPIDKQQELFAAFMQVDNSSVRKVEGTGLGLSICKALVEKMGGEIGVSSVPEKGSTFWFIIPLIIPLEEDFLKLVNLEEECKSDCLYKASVLVVEDIEVNTFIIKKMLESCGCRVDCAENGRVALKMSNNKDYDIIFMDCQMPVMDGFQATSEIRKINKTVPIIALTANVLAEEKEKCFSSGMNDFISKPVIKASFLPVLDKWLSHLAVCEIHIDEKVTELFGDNLDMVIELTIKDADIMIDNIKKAIDQVCFEDIKLNAHSLKSVVGQIGAIKLAEMMKELEIEAKANKMETVVNLYEQILSEYKIVKERLLDNQKPDE